MENNQIITNYYPVKFDKKSKLSTYSVNLQPRIDHSTLEPEELSLLR